MKNLKFMMLATGMAFFASCEKNESTEELNEVQEIETPAVEFRELKNNSFKVKLPENANSEIKSKIGGHSVTLFSAEYITSEDDGEIGNTIYFVNKGNKMLSSDFVADPAYTFDGTTDVSYYIDQNRPSQSVDLAASTAAIERAMTTWKNVNCSELGLYEVAYDSEFDSGVYAYFYGIFSGNDFGGSPFYAADVYHGGWLGAEFFDFLREGGSTSILGVTLTYTLTDENGNLTDYDNNGKADVGFREIYYNDYFLWKDGGNSNGADIETVALHEAGHGLSQAHFGKAFLTPSNGEVHFSPRAVMNATYSGIQTQVEKTDEAGHCANWAEWPNN